MPPPLLVLIACISWAWALARGTHAQAQPPDDVVWTSPSHDASGSMPLGNGDVGINLWVEEEGDLFFYLSKTDAWSQDDRLLKLGRVRLHFEPNPFAAGAPFRQALRPSTGSIEIDAGPSGAGLHLEIWVDANHPAVHLEGRAEAPYALEVRLESWRRERRVLAPRERSSSWEQRDWADPLAPIPDEVAEEPDVVLEDAGDRVVWYHRNERSIFEDSLDHQGLAELVPKLRDPLLGRTFGGAILGTELRRTSPTTLRSRSPAPLLGLAVVAHTSRAEAAEAWLAGLETAIRGLGGETRAAPRTLHERWWRDFWSRSWIRVSARCEAAREAELVTRGYALQRFVNACGGRGPYPIKFNGSIFTVDPVEPGEETFDPDYRRWGGCYWWQNTRLPYWAMPLAGDFDLMRPLFRMYLDTLPLARERTRIWYGHAGVFFPETMSSWGQFANTDYGRNAKEKSPPEADSRWIRHIWQDGLELTAMMLEVFDHTEDLAFLRDEVLPLAKDVLLFYERHFPHTEDGKLRLEPAQALETWQRAVNPTPELAALRAVLGRLLALPAGTVESSTLEEWKQLLAIVPELPIGEENGARFLRPAHEFDELSNIENPELYAVFPYRLYAVGKPDLDLARVTYARRRNQYWNGWHQDPIHAAWLGLAEEARKQVVARFSTPHERSRFEGFYGPNYDWVPDQDHPSVAMRALQSMLLQAEGDAIHVLPAWPKGWDVEFRLHAPRNTVLSGTVRGGRLESLEVAPLERRANVVLHELP